MVAGLALAGGCKPGVLKIGAAGPYSGELSKIGLDSYNAIKLAVDEINELGGIGGRQVALVMGDDEAQSSKAQTVAEKFVADKAMMGVVGPMNSNCVMSALPVYERGGLVMITQSGTFPEITDSGYKVAFRLCPRDEGQGGAAGDFIVNELGKTRVYLIDDKGTYGQGLADQVEAKIKSLGVEPVGRGQVAADDRDFASLLTLIRQKSPDLIYLALPNPSQAAALVKQARAMQITATFMGGDGLKEKDQLIAASAGSAEGMYVTAIGKEITEVPEAAGFIEKFEARHGSMSIFSGQSYEAAKILLEAMKRASAAGKMTRAEVLSQLRTIRYQGILGFEVGFDAQGDVVGARIYVLKVEGPDFVSVKDYPAEKPDQS
jgi:branched-chain amino acid transport system substrate-binding protein